MSPLLGWFVIGLAVVFLGAAVLNKLPLWPAVLCVIAEQVLERYR